MKRFARVHFSLIPFRLACLLLAAAALSWQVGYASVRGTRCMATNGSANCNATSNDFCDDEGAGASCLYCTGSFSVGPQYACGHSTETQTCVKSDDTEDCGDKMEGECNAGGPGTCSSTGMLLKAGGCGGFPVNCTGTT